MSDTPDIGRTTVTIHKDDIYYGLKKINIIDREKAKKCFALCFIFGKKII